jgi:hypothetical protein
MRATIKAGLLLAASAALVAGTLGPAEAASKHYKVGLTLTAYEIHGKKSTSHKLMDVSNDHEGDYIKIAGKVRGGPVKGKRVRIYATNTSDNNKTRYIGSAKLSKSGKFSKRDTPPRGGRWEYKVVKDKSGKYRGASKTRRINAFHWTHMYELHQGGAYNQPAGTGDVQILRGAARERTGPNIKPGKHVYSGYQWTEEFAINGGSSAGFDVTGYQCKKINMKIGISDSSPVDTGTIRVSQEGRTLLNLTMSKDQEPFDAMVENRQTRAFKDSLKANGKVQIAVETPGARFIVGNPKVYCTFPSVNR